MNWLKVNLLISIASSTCSYLSLKFFDAYTLKTEKVWVLLQTLLAINGGMRYLPNLSM